METNIFPIEFDFNEYQIYTLPYSEEKLKDLRSLHNQTHSFFRNGEKIYISNKTGEDDAIRASMEKVNIFDGQGITLSLVKHLLFRGFKERFPSIIPEDFYPLRFYSSQDKDDLIQEYLPPHLKGIIGYKKLIEIQIREINANRNRCYALVISAERNWTFNKSCLDLHNEGFPLIGTQVLHTTHLPGLETVLAADEEYIGIIKEVKDETAIVETNEGIQTYNLCELKPHKSKFNIANYLTYTLSEKQCNDILDRLDFRKKEVLNTKRNFNEIAAIASFIACHKPNDDVNEPYQYYNKDGFYFTVNTIPYKQAANSINLKPPIFLFDHSGSKTANNYPDNGLNNYGPYDSYTFDTKKPNILAICSKDKRGYFTQFLANLFDGLPQSKYFKKGLKKKYDLTDIDCKIVELINYEVDEYLRPLSFLDKKPDLAIIEIPDHFKEIKNNQSPYYRLKANFLTLEIPVQFVLTSKIIKHDEYILNAMGLQIYAKLGGTPWVLPSARSVDREIVVGIGHTMFRNNQFKNAEMNRVVGISTFFSSDGQYLLSNKAKDVAYEEYFNELLNNLNESFNKLKEEQGWKDGDTIRLIFHIFKPIKNVEFDVISNLIATFKNYKIQFAFVTISKHHPFKMFDLSQVGIYKFGRTIGEGIPGRAANIILDEASCLIQMLGASELKTDRHGASQPLLVRIQLPRGNFEIEEIRATLFTDLSYIVQQIYSFTYLSWRSFLPNETPATVLYSTLISKLLGKLRTVESWNPTVLNFNLKRKKWFL